MPASSSIVGRLASLASDVVVVGSAGASTIASSSKATIETLQPHAEPGLLAARHASTSALTSVLLSSTAAFTSLIPSLSTLSQTPTAVHVAVPATSDLSDVVALRSSGWAIVLSKTAQSAHDQGLIALKYAKQARRAVLHVYLEVDAADEFAEVEDDKVREFVDAPLPEDKHANGNGHVAHPAPEAFSAYERASLSTLALLRRPQRPYVYHGTQSAATVFVVFGTESSPLVEVAAKPDAPFGVLEVFLLRPIAPYRLVSALPADVKNVIVLEQSYKKTTRWSGLYLDVVSAYQQQEGAEVPKVFGGVLGHLSRGQLETEAHALITSIGSQKALVLGSVPAAPSAPAVAPVVPALESAYTKMLEQVFPDRLEISNSPSLVELAGAAATQPEYALGKVRADLARREELIEAVKGLLGSYNVDKAVHAAFAAWLLKKDEPASVELGTKAISILESSDAAHSKPGQKILALKALITPASRWIIGSDAWSYDLGSSGVHHAIASGENVNLLIIDSVPYTKRNAADANKRKKDIGLYAMNYGNVYVASVAVYSSYSQVLQAFHEADKFKGPSVVLAYLPYTETDATALEVLKETKLGVDTGYWPLYRWDPSQEVAGREPFTLDSENIKTELQEFLDRQQHLSQLTSAEPVLATDLVQSLGERLLTARKDKAQDAYAKLLSAFDGPPLLILFASDGGAAEKQAKRLATRAGLRGLATRCIALDEFPLEDLKLESHVAVVTSTAGQGEAPQNARLTFKALNAAQAKGETLFSADLKFTVFAMGDSHYWPRPEDAHYYNKPGKVPPPLPRSTAVLTQLTDHAPPPFATGP